MTKEKLDINEQIQDMIKKGISFRLISQKEAYAILTNSTYYFKLKAYKRNFKNQNGKYFGVDFAHIYELSKIDMYFRRMLFGILMDIEHSLKTAILKDFSTISKEVASKLVSDFLKSNYGIKTLAYLNQTRGDKSVSKLLIDSNKPFSKMPFWVLIEVVQLGNLLDIYKYFYKKRFKKFYKLSEINTILNTMFSLKCLRNSVAHNNCVLTNILDNTSHIQQKCCNILVSKRHKVQIKQDTIENMLSNQTISDFLMVVLLAKKIIKSDGLLQHIKGEIDTFFTKTCATKKRLRYFITHKELILRAKMVYLSYKEILSLS